MNDTTITCPKCGAEIPLTQAVAHRLREQLEADFQRRLAQERKKLQAEAARAAEAKVSLELKDLRNQLAERDARLKEAQQAELQLRKEKRALEDARKNFELDLQRRLDAERKKIVEDAARQAAEAERLKLADKDKVIADLQKQIAELQQRAQQGSVQLQGETLEITLEADLRAAFPFDEIAEVKKGQRGADITQRVRTNAGLDCGLILWEAKRARNWSADWPEKLREDQREAGADLAVIVTTCPPEGVRGIGQHDGVWVCEPGLAVALAAALRQGLVNTAVQRVQEVNRADKAQVLYAHLCSVEFRQHIEAVVEAFKGLQDQLEAEQRAFARQWKEREQQLRKAITHTAMLYGGIQGIVGREALPEIKSLALLPPD
ncbi:MAG: DUF2130 domain-containing protein [Verrucomicrobiae bacterium]|nr:DUF2130 domain-containing protein [Verrucomicrobiae bacterium]